MVKELRRRYVVFEALSQGALSKQALLKALNTLSRGAGLEDVERPWLILFESSLGGNRHVGIFKVPHTSKATVIGLIDGKEAEGIAFRTLLTTGSMRKAKRAMSEHLPPAPPVP